jgi:CheY-like chemotaxis protein
VVILDYWMADKDGLDVAAEVKRLNPKTPMPMLSGYTSILDEGLGRVDLWLRKGKGDPQQLLMAVAHLLNRNRPSP